VSQCETVTPIACAPPVGSEITSDVAFAGTSTTAVPRLPIFALVGVAAGSHSSVSTVPTAPV